MQQLGSRAPLWRRFKEQADPAARNTLIEGYLYLVRITVGRIAPSAPESCSRDALFAAGAVGLIEAVDRFDPARGVKFETLAITRIRGAILDQMRDADWAPRPLRTFVKHLEAAKISLRADGQDPTPEALATFLGVPLDTVLTGLSAPSRTHPVPLSSPVRRDAWDDPATLEETLVCDRPLPYDLAVRNERDAALWSAVDRLPDRWRMAIHLYYEQNRTCAEIGKALGVSESRAYQLIRLAQRRLALLLESKTSLFVEAVCE